jgi:hypothetical protein
VDPADAGYRFARAGFRAFELAGDGWRIVLSRVDVSSHEPRGIFTVSAAGRPEAFADLDDYVLARIAGLFGGTNLRSLARDLVQRLGGNEQEWLRRLDYLAQRTMREGAGASEVITFTGRPAKPTAPMFVFEGRVRSARTISLFGPGSAGKTTIADALAVSACTGYEVLPGWVPTRPFVVGLLDWDEGGVETQVRLHAITTAYSVDLTQYHYRRMSRALAECADDVGRWVVDNGIEILIISPVNRAARSATGDPGGPIFELYEVLRELGTTNILIDHVVGAAIGDHEATREYGSVAKRDAARGSYSVYEQSQEPGRRVVVLRNTKPDALAPKQAPQAVCIEYEPAHPDASGAYDAIRFLADEVAKGGTANVGPAETRPQRMVRILREHGPQTPRELCALSGLQARDLKDVARHAREAGHNVAWADGKWSVVNPGGLSS